MSKARDLANASTALGAVTATELGYVDGVTSAIQTQIDSKIGSASAINPTIVDAKGDIIAATAADTVARLAVGANDTVLTADSSTATGLKWATPAAGGMTVIASGNLSGSSTTISSIPATYNNLQLIVRDFFTLDSATQLIFRLNGNSTSGSYTQYSITAESSSVQTATTSRTFIATYLEATSDINTYAHLNLIDYTNAMNKYFEFGSSRTGTTNGGNRTGAGTFINTSAISSITITNENGVSVSGGSYILYGVK